MLQHFQSTSKWSHELAISTDLRIQYHSYETYNLFYITKCHLSHLNRVPHLLMTRSCICTFEARMIKVARLYCCDTSYLYIQYLNTPIYLRTCRVEHAGRLDCADPRCRDLVLLILFAPCRLSSNRAYNHNQLVAWCKDDHSLHEAECKEDHSCCAVTISTSRPSCHEDRAS